VSYAQAIGAAVVVALGAAASADTVFMGSIESGHAASATFGTLDDARNRDVVPAGIFVRVENTMAPEFDSVGARILTGVFFNIEGCPDLGQYIDTSRGLNGFEVYAGDQIGDPAEANPLDYWTWRGDIGQREGDDIIPQTFTGSAYALSATGLGVFGPGDVIGDPSVDPPNPNGVDGGVLSPTGDEPSGTNQFPVWRSFIRFQIFLTPDFFYQCGMPVFTDVAWQFGSDFSEPGFRADPPPIPLPTGAAMGLAGLGVVAARRRR